MADDEVINVPATVELSTSPELATKKGIQAVTQLMKLLDQKEKPVIINGKRHMEFDDWIILGNFYGIDVRTGDAEPVEIFGVKGAKAKAEVIRVDDGIVIGGAEAYCLANERNWKGKPWFQLASMAQTRAGSKALSNVLRGFVALKGISGTPAEEMVGVKRNNNPRTPTPPPSKNGKQPAPPKQSEPEGVQDAELSETYKPELFKDTNKGELVVELLKDEKKPLTRKNINARAVKLMPERLTMDDVKEITSVMDKADKA